MQEVSNKKLLGALKRLFYKKEGTSKKNPN